MSRAPLRQTSQPDADDAALAAALATALLPHLKASLVSSDPEMEAVQALESLKRGLAMQPGPRLGPPAVTVAPLRVPTPTTQATRTVRRVMTCDTYLRRLHVTGRMASRLVFAHVAREAGAFPPWCPPSHPLTRLYPLPTLNPLQADTLLPDMTTFLPHDTMRAQTNRNFFKRIVHMVDSYGYPHPVTYECFVSSGQRHARLSAGWGTLMRRLHAKKGDAVVLALYGHRDKGVLHVWVERA